MTTREEREAQIAAQLTAQISTQRRLARPEEYIYDKASERYWDLVTNSNHGREGVDASIPMELWRIETTDAPEVDPETPRGPGRPRQARSRPIAPSLDIRRVENDQMVEGITWWPGKPRIVNDYYISGEGFEPSAGCRIYNQYREPPNMNGNADGADPWIDHVKKLWPDKKEHEFFFNYCAHMLQYPDIKCNAAIVMSGTQGIGKDAALQPIRDAVGSWNTKGIDPDQLFSPFQPWLQSLMLVVNEVRPSKDEFHSSSMYNILKPLIAAPPHVLPLNNKNEKLRYVVNVMRVFITTNDWMAMYIPPEDRRMFIMHSGIKQNWHVDEGRPEYFIKFFTWLAQGGTANVAAWLKARDLSAFNPNGEVPKTAGWEAVSNTWDEPDDAISQALDMLGHPQVVFTSELVRVQFDGVEEIKGMLKSSRKIGNRMHRAGYLAVKPLGKAERFVFKRNEQVMFKSRLAFVKQGDFSNEADLHAAIQQHGERVAAVMAGPLLVPVAKKF